MNSISDKERENPIFLLVKYVFFWSLSPEVSLIDPNHQAVQSITSSLYYIGLPRLLIRRH